MHLFSIILIGLASNLDNFGIGVSYGVQKIRIPFLSNLFIAGLSFLSTFLAVLAGHSLTHWLLWANALGALGLIGIGLWVALHHSDNTSLPSAKPSASTFLISIKPLNCIIQITKNPSAADLDANGIISLKEALVLGFSLSLNCLATGVGAGLTGLTPLPTAVSVFLFSLLTISAGYHTGWKTADNWLERGSQIAAGVLLILIGLYELLV